MKTVLAFISTRNGVVQPLSLEVLSAARKFAQQTAASVQAVVIGVDPRSYASRLGAADTVLAIAHPSLAQEIPEAALTVLVDVTKRFEPEAVFFAYDTAGLDLAAPLALRTDRSLVCYATQFTAEPAFVTVESQAHGGKVRVSTRAPLPTVLMIMPGAFPEAVAERAPEIVDVAPPAGLDALRTQFVSFAEPDPTGFDIAAAEKIVCIGRGVKDKDGVAPARELAAALGAELAGSRPVIDNGWLPRDRQVGKSGRKVKPKLYLALGVSGAPEHLEGMSSSDLIIAVNTDAKAPIFGAAHYGATCDLFELIPALNDLLKSSKAP